MTRINVVPVTELCRQHLVAEYRELPRVFALAHKACVSGRAWSARQPSAYTLGTGHVLFFYDKLLFLAARHLELVKEMQRRGYKPTFTACLRLEWGDKFPATYWKGYVPTEQALIENRKRIQERTPRTA